jgi:ketosteroid isomerase-like protein
LRTILLLLALICAAPVFASAQQSVDENSVRIKILALKQSWNSAEQSKDTRAMDTIFDNSLVYVDYDGQLMTKAEFLAEINATDFHPEQLVTESMSVAIVGNVALASGIYHAKGIAAGKTYVHRGRFIDTWVHKDSSWLCIASVSGPIQH